VVDGDRRLNYGQVALRVLRLAAGFDALGLKVQDRVSIVSHNCLEFMEVYYAAAFSGLLANPINIRLQGQEMAYILRDAESRIVIAHGQYAEPILAALEEVDSVAGVIWLADEAPPIKGVSSQTYEAFVAGQAQDFKPRFLIPDDSPAHLYYTSGTTGRPKGVILTHRNVTSHALAAIAEFQLNDADVWLHAAPMFHLADAWATFAITWVGGRHVMLPQFDAGEALQIIEREKITITNLIPTMLNLMVSNPEAGRYDYSSLRTMLSGGSPIAPETVRRVLETFGCDYVQTYGLTETSPYCTVSTPKAHLKVLSPEKKRAILSRTGREFLAVALRVVDDHGEDVLPDDNTVGEVWVQGDTVFRGYWNRPEETNSAFQNGWFKTGDLAVIDGEGYINIVDRKKDMIVTGGENVYCNEVENALYEHPTVLECAVIGVPDEKWGEAVKAVVVKRPGLEVTEAELVRFVKSRIAHYKAPKSIDFVAEIPKTGSGKILKAAIKEKYWEGYRRRVH
jgi:acyl-CoA synthetase (AMP-forming)/AMP-acid ligase II